VKLIMAGYPALLVPIGGAARLPAAAQVEQYQYDRRLV
jgi:hypothetical protein